MSVRAAAFQTRRY